MGIDVTSRGLVRTTDVAASGTQSTEDKIPEDSSVNTQQKAEPPKLQNQSADAAARKAESGMKGNQLQSQLLNQTNKTISTGTTRTTNQQLSAPNAAELQRAFKMYGITNDQLQKYIVTGEEPEGLKKAINDASTKGEWLALNIVRSSYKMRAEYLRANSTPNDKESRAKADQLDAVAADLTRKRAEIQTNYAVGKLNASNEADQKQIAKATKDLHDTAAEIEARLRKKH
jgi:formylmethanofuran dehydrogenase subunit E-like metal-binding protein